MALAIVGIKLDIKGFDEGKASINSLGQALSDLAKEATGLSSVSSILKDMAGDLKELARDSKTAKTNISGLSGSFTKLAASLAKVKAAGINSTIPALGTNQPIPPVPVPNLDKASNDISGFISKVRQLEPELKEAVILVKELAKALGALGRASKLIATNLASATAGIKQFSDGLKTGIGNAPEELFRLSSFLKTTNQEAKTLGKALSKAFDLKISTNFQQLTQHVQNFGKTIKNFGSSLSNLGGRVRTLGFDLLFFVSIPIIAFFTNAAKSAIDLESSLAKLNSLTTLQVGSTAQLQGILSKLAVTVGQSLGALSEGLFVIASQGVTDLATALSILEVSAKASSIGLGSIEDVTRSVTAIMAVYSSEVDNAAGVTDLLIAAVREGNFEINELTPQIGEFLSLLKEVGATPAEGLAFIATFSRAGVDVNEAVTGLKAVLREIIKPSQQAFNALEEVGLSLEQIQTAITEKGLTETIIAVANAFEAANVPLAKFFTNSKALIAVLSLTGDLESTFLSITNSLRKSGGETDKAFKNIQATTGFQLQKLSAQFSVFANVIGSFLLPVINDLVSKLQPLLATLTELALKNPDFILLATVLALVVAALGPLTIILGSLISAVGTIVTAIGAFIGILGALLTPIGAVIAAIVVLAGAIGTILVSSVVSSGKKLNLTFSEIASRAFAWGRNITIQFARGIAAAIGAVIQALIGIGRVIRSYLQPGSPPKLLPDLDDWGAGALTAYMKGWLKGDFSIFDDIAGTIERFLNSIEIPELELIPMILGSRDLVAQAINELRQLGEISEGTLNQIVDLFGTASDLALDYIQDLVALEQANEDVVTAQDKIKGIEQAFDTQIDPIDTRLDAIGEERQGLKDVQRVKELAKILKQIRKGGVVGKNEKLAQHLALLELEEIQLRQRKDTLEENKDEALEAANAELEAAQASQVAAVAQLEASKALLDVQIDQNELIQKQIDLLEQLSDSLGGASDEASGLGDALGDELAGELTGLDDFFPDEEGFELNLEEIFGENFLSTLFGGSAMKDAKTDLDRFIHDITQPFINLKDDILELGDIWNEIFGLLPNTVREAFNDVKDAFPDSPEKLFGFGFGLIGEGLRLEFEGILDILSGDLIGGASKIGQGFSLAFIGNIAILDGLIQSGKLAIEGIIAILSGDFKLGGFKLGQSFSIALHGLISLLTGEGLGFGNMFANIVAFFNKTDWGSLATKIIEGIKLVLGGFWLAIEPLFTSLFVSMTAWFNKITWADLAHIAITFISEAFHLPFLLSVINKLGEWFAGIVDWFGKQDWKKIGFDATTKLLTGLENIFNWLIDLLGWYADVTDFFNTQKWFLLGDENSMKLKDGLNEGIDKFKIEDLPLWFTDILGLFEGKKKDFKLSGQEMLLEIGNGFADKAEELKEALLQIISGIIQAAQDFLSGVTWNLPDFSINGNFGSGGTGHTAPNTEDTGGGMGSGSNTPSGGDHGPNRGQPPTLVSQPIPAPIVPVSFPLKGGGSSNSNTINFNNSISDTMSQRVFEARTKRVLEGLLS